MRVTYRTVLLLVLGVGTVFGCSSQGGSTTTTPDAGASSGGNTAGGSSGTGTTSGSSSSGAAASSGSGASGSGSSSSGSGSSGSGSGSSGSSSGSSGGTCAPSGDPLIDQYVCCARPGAPQAATVVPTIPEQAYQHVELTAFVHYGLDTFDGTEQGNVSLDKPSLFAPSNLTQATVDHWVTTLQNAGFRQAMLVTKHSAGFTLWPTQSYTTNPFSVAASPWMNGMGDVVKMFCFWCLEWAPSSGAHLSPWDQHFPSSDASYKQGFTTQLKELLSNYGKVYEMEFDGFNSPGSHGTPQTVIWGDAFAQAKSLQKNILIWAGPEVSQQAAASNPHEFNELQWIGSENGTAVTDADGQPTSSLDNTNCAKDASGTFVVPNGSLWCPWEADVSAREPNWFWHPNQNPMSVASMESVYFNTVGRNATLIFNVPPDQTGDFDPNDTTLLNDFATWYKQAFQTNLLKGAPATADSTWSAAGFDAGNAVDGELCTYWAAASGMKAGQLTVTPASPITIKVISVREPIEMGERVTKWSVQAQQSGGSWTNVGLGTSQGTVIGNRQLVQVSPPLTNVSGLRLVIQSARDVPLISEFAAY